MGSITFASLGYQLLVNVVIAVIAFTIFNVLRTLEATRKFYTAKRFLNVPFRYRPPKPGGNFTNTYFLWWLRLFQISDDDFEACAGLDALTYIRFLSMSLKLSIYVGLVVFIIVLPVNWTSDAITCTTNTACSTANTDNLSIFDKTTLANVPNKSQRLWAHMAAVWIMSYFVWSFLWKENVRAVTSRIKYLASTRKGGESHTILVQNIPGVAYGTVAHRIIDYMDSPLGFFIPKKAKAWAAATMEGGIGAFDSLSDKVAAGVGKVPIVSQLSNRGPTEALDVYMTPDEDFEDCRSRLGSRTSSVSSMKRVPPAGGLVSDAPAAAPALGESSGRDLLPDDPKADAKAGRLPVTRRWLTLANRDPNEKLATDFDTWRQAEAAIKSGMSVEELVRKEFSRTYSERDIQVVTVVKDTEKLRGLGAQYEKTRRQLEDLTEYWLSRIISKTPIKRKMVKVNPPKLGSSAVEKWGSKPIKVEKSEFLEWKLDDLRDKMAEVQPEESCTAFVTFRRRLNQVQAAASLHYHNEAYWTTEPAMGPMEIEWGNIAMRGWERNVRFVLSWTLFIVMTLFYLIPITFLQAFIQVDKLKKWPGLSTVLSNGFLLAIVSGIVPGLMLKVFLAIVPFILAFMNKLQGVYSAPGIDFEVGRKYYVFLYTQVFVLFVLGGTLIKNSKDLVHNPTQFVKSLGQVIPSTASFYLSYVLVQGLMSIPVSSIRVAGVILFWIRTKLTATDKARKRLWAFQSMSYGADVPNHTLTLLFLLVFGIMSPFIIIPCIIYFVTASIVARYQLLYVFREEYQSGGRFWPILYDQIFAALVTFQIVMFATISVKQFPYSPIVIPPIIISFIFNAAVHSRFKRPLDALSAHAAADLDRADANHPALTPEEEAEMTAGMDCDHTPLGPVQQLYANPLFKVTEGHKEALEELAAMRKRVEARSMQDAAQKESVETGKDAAEGTAAPGDAGDVV